MARRLRDATEDDGSAQTNVPDDVYAKHLDGILTAHADMEQATEAARSARGVYRALLKTAKKDGCNPDAIAAALRERKLDQGERLHHYRDMGRVLRILGVPLGTQFSLFDQDFDDDDDAANATTPADGNGERLERANAQGIAAGRAGQGAGDNPYMRGSENEAWYQGWLEGQKQIVAGSRRRGGRSARTALQ